MLKGNNRLRTVTTGRALCCVVLLLAAAIDVAAERLPIRAFTTADGLPHNDIHRIVKDRVASSGSAPRTAVAPDVTPSST